MDEAPGADERAHRRGLRFRQREDYAVELLREAMRRLDDMPRVARILFELTRFYNPLIDAPIVDPATRHHMLHLLETGDADEVKRLLEERLERYAGPGGGEARDAAR